MRHQTSINIAAVVIGLLLIAFFVIPGPFDWNRRTPEQIAERRCFASQRVLEYSIQEHNSNHPGDPVTWIASDSLQKLVNSGHLKNSLGLCCYRVNRKRYNHYFVEKAVSLVSPLLSEDMNQLIIETDPASGTVNVRCLIHGRPDK